jgi:hypothetical protein
MQPMHYDPLSCRSVKTVRTRTVWQVSHPPRYRGARSKYCATLRFLGRSSTSRLTIFRGWRAPPTFLDSWPKSITYVRQLLLFNEFRETGMSKKLKYESAEDLRTNCPDFFLKMVGPYTGMRCATFESPKRGSSGFLISMQTCSRWSIEANSLGDCKAASKGQGGCNGSASSRASLRSLRLPAEESRSATQACSPPEITI